MSGESGSCLCGHIEVTCVELPKNVGACHCSSCQKASGGGPSLNIVIPDEQIRITSGQTAIFNDTAESGNPVERQFCPKCGSAICSKLTTRTVWKAGLFNHVDYLSLAVNVWSSRANRLVEVNTAVKTFEKGAS